MKPITHQLRVEMYRLLSAIPVILPIVFMGPAVSAGLAPPGQLCISTSDQQRCTSDQTNKGTKWHPGHYVQAAQGGKAFRRMIRDDSIMGGSVSIFWGLLEPKPHQYDFSSLKKTLAKFRDHDKYLIVRLGLTDFRDHTARKKSCAPPDLYKKGYVIENRYGDPTSANGKGPNGNGHVTACHVYTFIPKVQARLKAFLDALGKQFDDKPYFEGIATPETAGGHFPVPDGKPFGPPTPLENYQTTKAVAAMFKDAFPDSNVWQGANFASNWGRIDRFKSLNSSQIFNKFMQYLEGIGVGVIGPDLKFGKLTHAQRNFKAFAGRIPLAMGLQRTTIYYKRSNGQADPASDYDRAVNNPLYVNHLIWPANHNKSPVWSWNEGIIPILKKHDYGINTGCPKSNAPCMTK